APVLWRVEGGRRSCADRAAGRAVRRDGTSASSLQRCTGLPVRTGLSDCAVASLVGTSPLRLLTPRPSHDAGADAARAVVVVAAAVSPLGESAPRIHRRPGHLS